LARVLVVDDEQHNREVLEQELEFFGCEPVLAEDGRRARWIAWRAEPIDLALPDIMMPALDGYEVLCPNS
jgi:CheY-like chemotaxis protein